MSTEFQTLNNAKDGEKISFIGYITKMGDLKSGTNDKGDYTYKKFTIQDETASLELTAWNDEIKKFSLGGKYEIINAYAKEYKGKVGISIQYAEVKLIGKEEKQETLESKQESPPKEATKLPSMPDALDCFTETQTIKILQIEETVRKTLKHFKPLPPMQSYDGGYIGMMVKEIYRLSQKEEYGVGT